MIEEEVEFVKSTLRQAIGLLPDNALVGFVSFGTQVQVHELGFADMSKVYVFRGSKEISKDQILEQLGLGGAAARRPAGGYQKGGVGVGGGYPVSAVTRFLLPASDCEYTLNSVGLRVSFLNGNVALSFGCLCCVFVWRWLYLTRWFFGDCLLCFCFAAVG